MSFWFCVSIGICCCVTSSFGCWIASFQKKWQKQMFNSSKSNSFCSFFNVIATNCICVFINCLNWLRDKNRMDDIPVYQVYTDLPNSEFDHIPHVLMRIVLTMLCELLWAYGSYYYAYSVDQSIFIVIFIVCRVLRFLMLSFNEFQYTHTFAIYCASASYYM